MPLLNYTTKVPVQRTIGHVQALLVEAGARSIMTDYNEVGTPVGVAFIIETMHGPRTFKLPVFADRVHALLSADRHVEPRYSTPEHSERVAWRILKDWIEAQLAIIQAEQVTLDQVMLPYMQAEVGGRTVYELYRDQQLALTEGAPRAE
jgi:hypothetical protein